MGKHSMISTFNKLGLLGQGGAWSPTFLLRDDFTTNASAPLTSPRSCEPGPGTLTLVQNDGQLSVSASALSFPAQSTPVYGDLGLYSAAIPRVAGRALVYSINLSTVSYCRAGFNNGSAAADVFLDTLGIAPGGINICVSSAIDNGAGESLSTSTVYKIAITQRSTGTLGFLWRAGTWKLIWVFITANTASPRVSFSNYSAIGTLDNFRVLDLPAPFGTDYGLATTLLSGSQSASQAFTHEANGLVYFDSITKPSSGVVRVAVRYVDDNNCWIQEVNSSGDLKLIEKVAGVESTRITSAGVYTSGHRSSLIFDGTTIRQYSNNVLRGTYASASNFATATAGKILDLGTGGAVSDVNSWPRALSGSAASLLDQAVA